MNAIFICVIVLDKMCFHMLNLCWFKYKTIFECFRCFWKVFCFYQNWKFSKTVLPYFGDSVAGHPSCMPQSRARKSVLVTCSLVRGLVARGTQRFSRLSSRLPREWDFQSRKTLSKFFQIFWLEVFWWVSWRLTGDLYQSRKMRVLRFKDSFLKLFQFFPWTFYVYSLSLSIETDPNTPCHPLQTPFLHHLISRSLRTRYEFSLSHLIFHVLSIICLIFELSLCFEIYCVQTFFFA